MNSQQRPPTRSAPIRFNLTTVFSVTTMWAVLLAVMRLLQFPPRGYLIISLLFVVVAATRLLFRRFRYSVFVSMAAGILYVVVAEPIFRISQGLSIVTSWYELILCVLHGASYGLFAHICISVSLLLSKFLRSALHSRKDG